VDTVDLDVIAQGGIALVALAILWTLVRLASAGVILFKPSVDAERAALQQRIDAEARRVEALEGIIKTLSASQTEQVLPALRESITATVETDVVLKQMASQISDLVALMPRIAPGKTDAGP
jgi:hypothetical protein